MKRGKNAGFTLLELLLTLSLIGIVSLAIYANFESGIRVIQRVRMTSNDEDINIFLERFSQDLRNTFRYKLIPFMGSEEEVSFAAPIHTEPILGGNMGIGKVTYSYHDGDDKIERRQENLSQIHQDKPGNPVVFPFPIKSLLFEYFIYDSATKTYLWKETWNEMEANGVLPVAVKLTMEFNDQRPIERTIFIPIGG